MRFILDPTSELFKPRGIIRVARDALLYALIPTVFYVYPILEYPGEIEIEVRKYSFSFTKESALLTLYVMLVIGYATVFYAFSEYIKAYRYEVTLRTPREATLFGIIFSLLVASMFRPLYYARFAFVTMYFFGRIPIEVGYVVLSGGMDELIEAAKRLGERFEEILKEDLEYALEAKFVRAQSLAGYILGLIFFGSSILSESIARELGLAALIIRIFLVGLTFLSRILLDRVKKQAYLAFVSALLSSESEDRIKAYVLASVKLSKENTIKLLAIIASVLVNLL